MRDDLTWLEDPQLLDGVAKRLDSDFASLDAETKGYLRLYYDRPVIGADYTRPYRELAVFQSLKDSMGGNLTREVIDAAASILCREMAAEVLPRGAEFELEQGCKDASRLIEGVFDNSNFLEVATRAAIDGMTCPVGPIKGYIDEQTEEIKFERINPLDFRWVEDGTGAPRTFLVTEAISKDVLAARYPDQKSQIMDLPEWYPSTVVGVDPPSARRDTKTVRVIEAWCRALGPDSPGRHSVVTSDIVLEDEPWKHDITPVFGFRWSLDFRGFAGISLARIVGRYDAANRRLMRMVYAALAGAVPRLIVQEDAEIDGVSDKEFEIIRYSGAVQPKIETPQVVSPEIIQQIERNIQRAYAEGGVNQNMAQGTAPARYTSGAAQREFVDIANTRLLTAQKRWEQLWKDAAKVVVMLAQKARSAHVRIKGTNRYESVKFPRLSSDKYRINFGLSSGLSLTPAARLQELQDLSEMGLADVADVARNLNLPDTRALADRLNAPRDLVMQQISAALDKGQFIMPSSLQGAQLEALVRIGGEEYQRARLQGTYPPAHMEVLRRLIKAAEARMAPPPAPAAPPAPPPPANDNGAPPMAPPVDPSAAPPLPPEAMPPAPVPVAQ